MNLYNILPRSLRRTAHGGVPTWVVTLSPGVAAGFWGPGFQRLADHDDLAGVIAVVGDHLRDDGFQNASYVLVAFVGGFDWTIEFVRGQLCQADEFGDTPGHVPAETIPQLGIEGCICGQKTLGGVLRILWPVAANAAEFVAHPVIHVEDELADAVREAGNLFCGKFGGEIFNARDRIHVRAFSMEEFNQNLGHLRWKYLPIGLRYTPNESTLSTIVTTARRSRNRGKAHSRSGTKLAEVMIGMQITEAHPFLLGHVAKIGMIGPMKISRVAGEAVEEVSQFRHIALKFARGRALGLLVDLPQCLEALWPRDRCPQAAPLEESTRIREAGRSCGDQPQVEFVSVTQVADHLVRGHFSPAARSGRTNVVEAREDLILVPRMEQGVHASAFKEIRQV